MIPCDECITKAICINRKEVQCVILSSYLKKILHKYANPMVLNDYYVPPSLSGNYYFLSKYKITIDVYENDEICIWKSPALGVYEERFELKYLYSLLQKIGKK
jgi:hypothetical protein